MIALDLSPLALRLVQTSLDPTSTVLLSWLVQPAIVLGGIGLFTRLVLWPALKNLMRNEIKHDIQRIDRHEGKIRDLESRTEAHSVALAQLSEVPVILARIEANVQTLMERDR